MLEIHPSRVIDARQLGRVTCHDCGATAPLARLDLAVLLRPRCCAEGAADRIVDLGTDGAILACVACLPAHLALAAAPWTPGVFTLPTGWTEHALDGTAHCAACAASLEDDTAED